LAVARVPLRWGYIFIIGILIPVVSYIIRALPVTFGFHLPVVIFLLFILMLKFTNLTPSRTIIAVFTSLATLTLLEYLVTSVFFAYTHMDYQSAMANEGLWAAVGVFQSGILNIIAFVVPHFLKPTEGAWKR
jgi:hypothetical protein